MDDFVLEKVKVKKENLEEKERDWRGTIMDMGIGGETGSHPPHCKNMNTDKTE